MGFRYMGLCIGGVSDSSTSLFLFPLTPPTPLTGSVPKSKTSRAPGPALAGLSLRNASSTIEGLQNNRCSLSHPFHNPGVGVGGRRWPAPRQQGQGLGQNLGASRAGAGPPGDEAF